MIHFGDHILPIPVPVILTLGALVVKMKTMGKPLPAIHSLLAVTAVENSLILATKNVRQFEATGISLFNPWDYEG